MHEGILVGNTKGSSLEPWKEIRGAHFGHMALSPGPRYAEVHGVGGWGAKVGSAKGENHFVWVRNAVRIPVDAF